MPKVFVSHSWKDKEIAKKLVNGLKNLGCEVWIDDERINAGDVITDGISQALKQCDTFLLLWSEFAASSKVVGLEWSSIIAKNKRFIACRLDQTELPELLHGLLYIEFNDFDQGFLKLCKALQLDTIKSYEPGATPRQIYVSSTIEDLVNHRQAVRHEIERLGHIFAGAERLQASGGEISKLYQDEIENCDLFIGIYAHRYGFVPSSHEKSIIEQEYDLAERLGKPCFLYVLDDEAEWKTKYVDRGEASHKLDQFKEKIKTKHAIEKFRTSYDLATAVSEATYRWALAKREENISQSDMQERTVEKYKQAMRNAYAVLNVLDRRRTFSMERGYISLSLRTKKSGESGGNGLNTNVLTTGKENVSVVLGLPGTGKTTLLHYLAFCESSEESGLFPIYVRLARFGITGDDLEAYLQKEIGQYIARVEVEEIVKSDLFCGEKYFVLLDGLDEVRQEDYNPVLRRIHSFVDGHRHCRIVITSRPVGFKVDDWADYPIYEIEPLTEEKIIEYIRAWFDSQKERGNQLVEKLKQHERLFELATTPFLLAMICLIYENDGKIEKRRSSLYRQCTEYLNGLRDWDPQRKKRDGSNDNISQYMLKETILKTSALHFFQLQKNEFSREEFEFVAQRALPLDQQARFGEILQQIYKRSGVLQQAGNSVHFVHRTIFEYYVACAMLDLNQPTLLDWTTNPKYEEPFRLYAGLLQDDTKKESLLKGIWQRNPALALLCVTEMEDSPDQKIMALLYSVDKRERVRLVQALDSSLAYLPQDSGVRMALETMQILFQHEKDCEVLWWGAQFLEKIDPVDSKRILWEKLDKDAELRRKKFMSNSMYKFELVRLPGGEFLMGNDKAKFRREKPAHTVRLSPFSIGKFPVTNLLFKQFIQTLDDTQINTLSYGKDTHPVGAVNWYQAAIFCRWLGCRIPTEAEWEYACRAGTNTEYFFGDDPKALDQYAWYLENANEESHPVGEKKPNPLGLFDIIGNVCEWCADWYDRNYYKMCKDQGVVVNPLATNGDRRIVRGGSFFESAIILRSSVRYAIYPDIGLDDDVGVRVVISES